MKWFVYGSSRSINSWQLAWSQKYFLAVLEHHFGACSYYLKKLWARALHCACARCSAKEEASVAAAGKTESSSQKIAALAAKSWELLLPAGTQWRNSVANFICQKLYKNATVWSILAIIPAKRPWKTSKGCVGKHPKTCQTFIFGGIPGLFFKRYS